MTEPLVPRRRFKQFQHTEAWERRKLGEITNSFSGGTPQANNRNYYSGCIPFIRSGDIHAHVTELFITEEALNHSSAKLVFEGDILYALYGATSGEVGISQINGAINQAILAIRPIFGDSSYMITQWLKKQKQMIISTYLQGGQGNLSGSIIKNLMIDLPKSKEEQARIGLFFTEFERLLALHRRRLEKTKALKLAYLAEMFPAEGEVKPERRFPGFTEAWEQRKLGEVCEGSYGGGTPGTSVAEYWSGHIAWIQSSDLVEEQLSNVVPRKKITEAGLRNSATKLIPENSIAIVIRVGVGKLALMPYEYTTSQDFLSLSKLKIDSWFGVYSVWKKLQSELHSVQGTSIKGITKEELLSKTIMVSPRYEEQSRIGEVFREMDRLIFLYQRRMEKLQNIKKAYLTEMFI